MQFLYEIKIVKIFFLKNFLFLMKKKPGKITKGYRIKKKHFVYMYSIYIELF